MSFFHGDFSENFQQRNLHVGGGDREGNRPKTLVLLGNAMTIKFRKCKCDCREMLLSLRRLLILRAQDHSKKYQKNPSATPPPPNPKIPPPKTRNFMGMERQRLFPGAHKIGAAISGPRIAGNKKNLRTRRIFLKK